MTRLPTPRTSPINGGTIDAVAEDQSERIKSKSFMIR